jgi:hypothetical protein
MFRFRCAKCGEQCLSTWTDAEAHAEAVATFGRDGHAPGMVRVCDDCYRDLMARDARPDAAQARPLRDPA